MRSANGHFSQTVSDLHGLFELKRGVPALFSPDGPRPSSRPKTYWEFVPLDLFPMISSYRYGWTVTHRMMEHERNEWTKQKTVAVKRAHKPLAAEQMSTRPKRRLINDEA